MHIICDLNLEVKMSTVFMDMNTCSPCHVHRVMFTHVHRVMGKILETSKTSRFLWEIENKRTHMSLSKTNSILLWMAVLYVNHQFDNENYEGKASVLPVKQTESTFQMIEVTHLNIIAFTTLNSMNNIAIPSMFTKQ